MKKIALTGGLGFIGGNFLRYMYNKYPQYSFHIIDKVTYASGESGFSDENIKDLIDGKRVKFFKYDICDKDGVYDSLYLCDAVVSFAAESHVGRAMVQGKKHLMSNDVGATVVGEVASDYHIRMVQISTDEVYGQIETGKFHEDLKLNPKNRYAASKAAAEMNLRALTYPPHNLDLVITRSGNNYGIYQSQEKFVHVIAECIAKNTPITIHGKGEEMREWLWVEDNCRAIDLILHEGKSGEVYNIGSHNEMRNVDLAQMAIAKFGGSIQFVPNRPGNDIRYALDTTKIESLGWKPIAIGDKFKETMLDTIEYYISKYKRDDSKSLGFSK